MKILEDKRNDLLNRNEVKVSLESYSNPGKAEVALKISNHFKKEQDCVVIRKLGSHFGKHVFNVEATIYDSKEEKERVEEKPKVKKGAA